MMTEEQKQQLIDRCQKHITWLLTLTPEAMTVCNSVKEQLDIYGIALAALTQPASPAFKLPDGWAAVPNEPNEDMLAAGSAVDGGVYSIWKDMVGASPDAPHTAPIEPICATGGAEWVKVSERMPDEEGKDGRILVCCGGEVKTGFYDFLSKFSDADGYPLFSEVTHWMPIPAAPEEK